MSDITLSSAVRSNLLSLQSTADLMSKTQERLATGLKVNSALDNPTNFFTASSLNSRASDLSRLLDGVSNATQTLEAADNGISAITKLVESAQATVRQAQQTSGTIDSTALLNGSALANDVAATTTGSIDLGTDASGLTGTTVAGLNADDTGATVTGSASGIAGSDLSSTLFAGGDTLSVDIGGESVTIEFATDETSGAVGGGNVRVELGNSGTGAFDVDTVLASVQTALQNDAGTNGDAATVGLSAGGEIEISSGAVGAGAVSVTETGASDEFTGAVAATGSDTNSTLAGLTGDLTFTDTNGTQTIDLNTIDSAADLTSALGGLTGITAAADANGISFSGGTESFTIAGTDATALGFASGASETTNAAIGALSGTLTVGADTLTFGSGNIETRADLETALAGLTGVTGSIDGSNNLVLTSDDAAENFTVGGTAAAGLGVTAQEYTGSNAALSAATGTATIAIGDDAAQDIDLSSINSVEDLATALGSVTGATYDATDGRVELTASSSGESITLGGDAAALTALGGFTAGETASSEDVNPERAEFISQYNEIVGQINELAEDASFNGVNLLDGDDLSVIFNEDGSSQLDIAGVTFDSTGLGLSELATTAFDTDASIDTVLGNLDTAIGSLRSQASEFGSNLSIVETREDFTKATINTLETGAANLTLADTNQEGANLLALQTRQSLSSTALSLASQADQNVLRLF